MRHLPYVLLLLSGGILARPYFVKQAPEPVIAAATPTAVATPQATPPWGISELNRGAYNRNYGASGGPTYVGPDTVYVSNPVFVTNRTAPVYFPSAPMRARNEVPYTPNRLEHEHEHEYHAPQSSAPQSSSPTLVARQPATTRPVITRPTTTRTTTTSYDPTH